MVAQFCTSGEKEALKGGVHATACGLAVVMAVYNGAAWWYRRERHLGINTALYTAAAAWEVMQTSRHWSRPGSAHRSRTPCVSNAEPLARTHEGVQDNAA